MAFNYRGRRVAYDNIAAGSVAGVENTISMSTAQDNVEAVTDVSIYNVQEVSPPGSVRESPTAGVDGGARDNIAIGSSGGIEDNDNATGDKFTSEGETITNTPSVD